MDGEGSDLVLGGPLPRGNTALIIWNECPLKAKPVINNLKSYEQGESHLPLCGSK